MAWNPFRRKKKLHKRVLLALDELDKHGWARSYTEVFIEGKACLWTATEAEVRGAIKETAAILKKRGL